MLHTLHLSSTPAVILNLMDEAAPGSAGSFMYAAGAGSEDQDDIYGGQGHIKQLTVQQPRRLVTGLPPVLPQVELLLGQEVLRLGQHVLQLAQLKVILPANEEDVIIRGQGDIV